MKKALITGITGQDGSYLARLLLEKGYKVFGIVRAKKPTRLINLQYLDIDRRVSLSPMNLLDPKKGADIIRKINPDEVYHLASQSSVAQSFLYPVETLEFNLISTLNVLAAIQQSSLKSKFYQAASSEMYGCVKKLPVNENSEFHPVSPYAISKVTEYWTAMQYRQAYGMYCCCGILFNHESVLRQSHFATKKILSAAVRISQGAKEKLKLGNIEAKRDWGYAPEYVKAMWMMLQQKTPDNYILATSEAHSLKEFAELTFAYLGLNWKKYVVIDPKLYRPSDIPVLYGDPSKARKKLGWKYTLRFQDLIKLLVDEEIEFQKFIANRKK